MNVFYNYGQIQGGDEEFYVNIVAAESTYMWNETASTRLVLEHLSTDGDKKTGHLQL